MNLRPVLRVFSTISDILLMSSKVQADARLAGKGELEKRSRGRLDHQPPPPALFPRSPKRAEDASW